MISLGVHLTAGERHDGLRFHPACPHCRDARLAGSLPPFALLSLRGRALLAATAFALTPSAWTATAARADEGDQTQEGTADPAGQDAPDDPGNPLLSAGGDQDGGPDIDAGAEPTADTPDGTGQADPDPLTAPDPSTEAIQPDQLQSIEPVVPVSPPPTPPATSPVTPAPSSPTAPQPAQSPPPQPKKRTVRHPRSRAARPSSSRPPSLATRPTTTPIAPEPALQPAGASTRSAEASHAAQRPAADHQGTHVVVAGESLWSIARASLGPEASNGRVAALVHELWVLNASVIGTGDPNLVPVGAHLHVPRSR